MKVRRPKKASLMIVGWGSRETDYIGGTKHEVAVVLGNGRTCYFVFKHYGPVGWDQDPLLMTLDDIRFPSRRRPKP